MFGSHLLESTRRRFLQLSAAGVGTASLSGWLKALANNPAAAPTQRSRGRVKSVILLWMDGGPSHKDTFDLKPDSKGAGDFRPIATSVPGIEISEHLPQLAKWMHKGTIVRGMSSPEGAHARAKYNLHTGYREGQGGLSYPSIGSIVACEKGSPEASVPNFVSIGTRTYGSGFLGPKYQPLIVTSPSRGVEDLKATVSERQFDNRLGLLGEMEAAFRGQYKADVIVDHKTAYERAVQLMHSQEAKAFDISLEPSAAKSRYGSGNFADSVLMARRLVEVGVPFIEASLGGWDTHQDNWTKVKSNSQQVDAAMSALIADLNERGLLDSTLIIWMGEFGRTPHINTRGAKPGRDHYPKAWSLAMFGGGMAGGRVIGRTDKEGAIVEERKVAPVDFLATVCELMGIDHTRKNETPTGRPVQIVEKPNAFTQEIL
ncbi:MAG: DUF1501 domain-containing protein [Bacteroidales bacterium]|nr:DUF1501 domain-containing protein [Bacteroidales bacterium]